MRYYNVELLDSLPFPPFGYEERNGRLHLAVPDDLLRPLVSTWCARRRASFPIFTTFRATTR